MSERLVLPPNYPTVEGPVIFLAGPIQGASMWQTKAIEYIHSKAPQLWIASPRCGQFRTNDNFVYNEQVDWETTFLRRAADQGTIMFWLAKEEIHHPERAYAQTTRFELAEWKIRHERGGINLILGIEPGFSNERYIRRRFGQDCPKIQVQDTLEATCQAAIDASLG